MGPILYISIGLGILAMTETKHVNIIPPKTDTYGVNSVIMYVMFTDIDATFNEARTLCQQYGGDLAKIDSQELMEDIQREVEENYQYTDFFKQDYWIGIIRPTNDTYFWVADCSIATYTSHYDYGYDEQEYCFRHKKDDHSSERKSCDSTQAALCQINTNNLCPYVPRLESFAKVSSSSVSTCENQCTSTTGCWGTVQVEPNHSCVLLMADNMGPDTVNVTSKFCVGVSINTDTPSLTGNYDKLPNHNCTVGGSVTTPPPFVSSIAPTSSTNCPTVTMTPSSVYVTATSTVTMNVTVTDTATSTVTDATVTSHINTLTVTSTFVCSTGTVTISPTPLYVTDTLTVTTTEFSTVQSVHTSCSHIPIVSSIAIEKIESVAEEIVRNLTVDTSSTSSYIRSLTSASDDRTSSKFIGLVGVLFIAVPMGILFISDCFKMYYAFRYGPTVKK